ncbi:hypothetical protein [Chitinibacter sp. GC72]|uniref:hypothetical protein n=1 Tax=Chitinibacter sp. GC72 TaxID=1526917 RepID=UPI0018DFD480|nr:hypothetical protein [Chitinibacter sp. GC72]
MKPIVAGSTPAPRLQGHTNETRSTRCGALSHRSNAAGVRFSAHQREQQEMPQSWAAPLVPAHALVNRTSALRCSRVLNKENKNVATLSS